MGKQRARIIAKGRVQGVFYRASAKQKANELGVTGWAKNSLDGSVEIVAEGEESTLLALIDWCKTGPADALVTDVEVDWKEYRAEFVEFKVLYS